MPLLISESRPVSSRNCGALCVDFHDIVPKAPRRADISSDTAFLIDGLNQQIRALLAAQVEAIAVIHPHPIEAIVDELLGQG